MRIMILLFLTLSLAVPAAAQKELTALLDKIRNEPVEMTFSLEIYWSIREKSEKKKGNLLLAGEDNFDLSLDKSRWVSDGVTVWQYSDKSDQLVIRSFMDMDFSLHPSTMFDRFGERKFKSIREDDDDIFRWADVDDPEYSRIDLKFNDKKNSFKWILFVDKDGNESRYRFSKMEFLKAVDEDRFTFTAPEGTEVFDER